MIKGEDKIITKINVEDVVQDTAQPRQDWDKHEKALLLLTKDIEEKGLYYLLLLLRL